MKHTKTCIWTAGKILAVLVSVIATIASARTASAAPKSLPPATDVLSVASSMRHDPDAITCLKAACSAGLPNDLFVIEIGRCQSDHLTRVRNTLTHGSGDKLGALPYTTSVYTGAMTCEAMSGKPDVAVVAKLNELEAQRVALVDKAKQDPPAPPVEVAAGPAKSEKQKPAKLALTTFKNEGDGVSSADVIKDPAPAAFAGSWGSDPCLPPHFRLISKDADEAVLFVEAGADYVSLSRSCLAKEYDTDPREIVEANTVERTIPYCDAADGKRTFDPARYADILSGKKKLVLGDPANSAFLDECEKSGGTVGVALQGRQRLTLIALDEGSDTDDAEKTPGKKHASVSPTTQKSGANVPASEETEKIGSSVRQARSWFPGGTVWDPYGDEGKVRYAALTPSTRHPVEASPSSIRSNPDPELPITGVQTTWPPPRPPPQA